MRVSIFFSVAFAALLSLQVSAQTCRQTSALCAATPPQIPTPWFELNFNTDPRTLPGVTNPVYSWRQQYANDPCSQFHQGLLHLPGSTVNSWTAGPWVNLTQSTGSNSVGTALPTNKNIGGTSPGSFYDGSNGWTMELTFRADAEGDRTQWAKIVSLGTNQKNSPVDRCNGEWLVGWIDRSDELSMGTCRDNDENKVDNFLVDAEDNAWYHVVSVIQNAPNGRSTYLMYVNGVLAGTRTDSNPLVDIFRDRAGFGRSSWPDAYYNGTIDHFALYDVALTPVHAQSLYTARMAGCTITYSPFTNGTVPTGTAVTPIIDIQFTEDITRAPGVPADFTWVAQDPDDTACGIQGHRGLLTLAGDADWRPSVSAGPFVNLSASAGENYIGTTVTQTFGGVTGTVDTTAGFSVEVSFKSAFQNPYSKVWAVGNADATPCLPGDMWAGWSASDYALEMMYCDNQRATRTVVARGVPLLVRTWHHLVVAVSPMPNNASQAIWRVYLDGAFVAITTNQYFPQAIPRKNLLLGRSMYFGTTDTYYSGSIDRFAVYNRALTPSQVSNLASTATFGACPQRNNNAFELPAAATVLRATWANDPRPAGAQYGWLQVDANDTAADQAIHTGMLLLGPGAGGRNTNQWVNLTATSGPNSATGVTLNRWIGGEGSGPYLDSRKGWTFEVTFKILPTPTTVFNSTLFIGDRGNGQAWAKVFDFGDGNKGDNRDQCENDIILGFNDVNNWMRFEVCNPVNFGSNVGDVAKRPLKVNTWYHVVGTQRLTPQGPIGSLYINGEHVESTLMRNYPLFASRQDARIGMSSWGGDQRFNGMVELMGIYSESVNQAQVNMLYALAFNRTLPSSTGTNNPSSSSTSTTGTSTGSTGVNPVDSTGTDGGGGGNGVGQISMSLVSIVLVVVAAAFSM